MRCAKCGAVEASSIHHVNSTNHEIRRAAHPFVPATRAHETEREHQLVMELLLARQQIGAAYEALQAGGFAEASPDLAVAVRRCLEQRDSAGLALISAKQEWDEAKTRLDALTKMLRDALLRWEKRSATHALKAMTSIDPYDSGIHEAYETCIREIEEALAGWPVHRCEICGRFFSSPLPDSSACDDHVYDYNRRIELKRKSPAAREAQASPSVSCSNDGENQASSQPDLTGTGWQEKEKELSNANGQTVPSSPPERATAPTNGALRPLEEVCAALRQHSAHVAAGNGVQADGVIEDLKRRLL